MIYLFLADGFEECEALVPLDILRRANIEVKTVGIGKKEILGAHNVLITADLNENEVVLDGNLKGVILPGGMPGTTNLEKNETVQRAVEYAYNNNLLMAAICAAPSILGHKGYLKGKNATSYPSMLKELKEANITEAPVVCDSNIITSRGAGAAFDFGFEILAYLESIETAENMKKTMLY